MINLYDSNIIDIIPDNLKIEPQVQALGYALQQMNQRLVNYSKRVAFINSVDQLPEELLDLLAVELRTQYYDEDIPIEIKRSIIKNTLMWYGSAGTASAVEELITATFGSGTVKEWFEYEAGQRVPGTFDIQTHEPMVPGVINKFSEIIKNVKNIRSHLYEIYFITDVDANISLGLGNVCTPTLTIVDSGL